MFVRLCLSICLYPRVNEKERIFNHRRKKRKEIVGRYVLAYNITLTDVFLNKFAKCSFSHLFFSTCRLFLHYQNIEYCVLILDMSYSLMYSQIIHCFERRQVLTNVIHASSSLKDKLNVGERKHVGKTNKQTSMRRI